MQTTFLKQADATHDWFITSAKGQVLGRLATRIALRLMGKQKPNFTPGTDNGDYVVVTDIESLEVTGKKADRKIYRFHTGYIGSLTEIPFRKLHAARPDDVLQLAVKRMLPKTTTGRNMLKRLMLYKGTAHPHAAQGPKPL